jgi:hypothetical protein
MFRNIFKISLLIFLLIVSACKKSGDSPGSLNILGDDTTEAVKLIEDANNDLKEVKRIYKDNQGKVAELQAAMANNEVAKVKNISGNLVDEIDNGVAAGRSAVKKIEDAQALNINETYKKYLEMKQECLVKQLEAFEYRRDAAKIFSDGFGGDKAQSARVIAEFKVKEANFQKLMNEGLALSQDANDFAKDSLKKAKKQ